MIFQPFFLGVGLLISLRVKRVRNVTPYAFGMGFGAYVLSAFSGVFGDVALELLKPFKYFDAGELFRTGELDGAYLLLSALIIAVCMAAAYWTYNKRDLYI